MCQLTDDGRIEPLFTAFDASPRQRHRGVYVLNGAVYVADLDAYRREGTFLTEHTVAYVMPEDRSVDLDSTADFALADALLKSRLEHQEQAVDQTR